MTENVVPFLPYTKLRSYTYTKPVWVPEYGLKVNEEGRGIPYWTGFEFLCVLRRNPEFRGDYSDLPYFYEDVGGDATRRIKRAAPPPECEVSKFDWSVFELEACGSR